MKKFLVKFIALIGVIVLLFTAACDKKDEYILSEQTFFLVMTNMQYYPTQYLGCDIELDCFTYELEDVNGEKYICGVRKCSAGYGCTCGNDTIIGFILDYEGEIPAPVNQSEDTNDKTWIHIKGKLKSDKFKKIEIHSYDADGKVVVGKNEFIPFLEFEVESLQKVEDYSKLNYYVTK